MNYLTVTGCRVYFEGEVPICANWPGRDSIDERNIKEKQKDLQDVLNKCGFNVTVQTPEQWFDDEEDGDWDWSAEIN